MRLLLMYCLSVVVMIAGAPVWSGEHPARVMVVHSYGSQHVCGRPQGEGVAARLAARGWLEGHNLELRSFYMDTKKTYTTPEAIRERARLALEAIEAFRPQVVVVLDDNAIREVMLPLVGRADIAVVFSGMNGQPEDYDRKVRFMESRSRPGHNVTGVYEKLHLRKSLRVMAAALGDVRPEDRVVGITDYSPTGRAITRQFELELQEDMGNFSWELRRVHDLAEYKALIEELNADPQVRAIYPAALRLKDENGETHIANQIFAWTVAHSRKPEMALNYFFSQLGLFGGAAVDFRAMGEMAGEKVARILNGTPAGEIPVEDARDYAIVFNRARARQLGIDIPEALLTAADQVYDHIALPALAKRSRGAGLAVAEDRVAENR